MKIEIIKFGDKNYPKKLRNIENPPKKLYVCGNIDLLNEKNIAIVGTRMASDYGKKAAFNLSKDLSKCGINIISGLAIGIDSYSHLGTFVNNLGKTIAVLGSGFNEIYPKQNIELARKIVKNGGLVITEYEFDEKPNKINFPYRNRIISGLSDGVIVVEGGIKSGAIITANWALDQGKEVFAVPGNIYSSLSEGTNQLLKDGAKLVTNYIDIIEELI